MVCSKLLEVLVVREGRVEWRFVPGQELDLESGTHILGRKKNMQRPSLLVIRLEASAIRMQQRVSLPDLWQFQVVLRSVCFATTQNVICCASLFRT